MANHSNSIPIPGLAFVFCLLYPILGLSQFTLSGTVLDSASLEPIPYVNIGIPDKGIGTTTDKSGHFTLSIPDHPLPIRVSCIGYEAKTINLISANQDLRILLRPKAYYMAFIEISAERFNGPERLFGVRHEKGRGPSMGFSGALLGTEIAAKIPIDKPTYLKSAHFVFNHASGDSLTFRVNIYDFADGVLGENLLYENIIISEKQKPGTLNVDLEPYEIVVRNDVILGLEWVADDSGKGNEGLTFDLKKSRKHGGVYMKMTSQQKLQMSPYRKNYKPCFYFLGKQSL